MKRIFTFAKGVQLSSSLPPHPLVHPPLKAARDIRLVKLLPGSTTSTINCELQTVSLESDPVYLALSYRWGDASNKTWITCNSQRYDITRDLLVALKRFRRKDQAVIFWIDQICINQADLEERAAQVRLMQEIYSRAKLVYIWLGPEGENSGLALKMVPWLLRAVLKHQGLHSGDCGQWNDTMLQEISHASDKELKALSALIRRPWFSRVWIIQEVSAAKQARLVCGKDELEWKDFAAAMPAVMSLGMNLTGAMPPQHWRLHYLLHAQKHFRKDGHLPFHYLMTESRYFEATDSRDKVFAILGLCPKYDVMKIDYAKNVCDILIDVTTAMIFDTRGELSNSSDWTIGITLAQSQGTSNLPLPSWVTDWTTPSTTHFEIQARSEVKYKAGGQGDIKVWKTDDRRRIRVRGKLFDSVQTISSIAPQPKTSEFDKAFLHGGSARKFYEHLQPDRFLLNCWINETSAIAWSCSRYSDDQSRIDAYSRTLICNNTSRFVSGQLPPDEAMRQSYWHFRRCLDIMYPAGVPNGAPLISIAHAINASITGFELFDIVSQSLGIGRRFVATTGGYMALSNACVLPGDLICVLEGGAVPWVLRRDGDEYLVIGECYVHGAMSGEVMETEALELQDIILK